MQFNGPGADYAEFLSLLDRDEQVEVGDVVGVFNGSMSHRTAAADQVMAVTDQAN